MSHPNLPITEVLVVADCWQREPESEAVIQRAVAAAAENVDEDVAEAEVAVVLTQDAGIRTPQNKWRRIHKPTNAVSFSPPQPGGGWEPGRSAPQLGGIRIPHQAN